MTEIKPIHILIVLMIIGFIIMSLVVVWISTRIFDNIASYLEQLINYLGEKLP